MFSFWKKNWWSEKHLSTVLHLSICPSVSQITFNSTFSSRHLFLLRARWDLCFVCLFSARDCSYIPNPQAWPMASLSSFPRKSPPSTFMSKRREFICRSCRPFYLKDQNSMLFLKWREDSDCQAVVKICFNLFPECRKELFPLGEELRFESNVERITLHQWVFLVDLAEEVISCQLTTSIAVRLDMKQVPPNLRFWTSTWNQRPTVYMRKPRFRLTAQLKWLMTLESLTIRNLQQ